MKSPLNISFIMFSVSWLALSTFSAHAQTTVLPHFTYKDGTWNTELSLYVPGPDDQLVTICAYDNAGDIHATSELRINGLAGFHGTVYDLFPDLSIDAGWLEFSGDSVDLEGIM